MVWLPQESSVNEPRPCEFFLFSLNQGRSLPVAQPGRGTHQVHAVRADVAPLVIGVNGEVEPHEVIKLGVVEAQLMRKVRAVVQARVRGNELPALERAAKKGNV